MTRFSFGEPLPVLAHSLTDPEMPGFYLDNCARLLASDFREAAGIIDPRAPEPQDSTAQVLSLIQQAPIDEQRLNRLLRLAEAELGEGAELAALLNGVGVALLDQARFAAAEPFFRRALVMEEKSAGLEHPDVARDLNNLAQLLQATNRLGEAEPLLRRALASTRRASGPSIPQSPSDSTPGHASSSHQPPRRGRAPNAPGPGHSPEVLALDRTPSPRYEGRTKQLHGAHGEDVAG